MNQVVINLAREMLKSGVFEPIVLITDWDAVDPVWKEVDGLRTVRWRIRGFHLNMSIKEKVAFWLWRRRFRPAFEVFCREHQVVAINPHFPDSSAITISQIINSFDDSTF